MAAHPDSSVLQEHGCAMLGNQASQAEAQQRALVEMGAVRAVTKSMRDHPDNVKVQETACWALREFAVHSEGRHAVQAADGIELVLQAMRDHVGAAPVLEHGCMALAYLSCEAGPRRSVAQAGGIAAVLRGMRGFPEDPVVQEAGCLALRNLGCSREHRRAADELHSDREILQCMRMHAGSAALQETALDALLVLSLPPEQMAETSALELALHAAELHRVEGLHAKVCLLIAYLGKAGEPARAQLADFAAADFLRRAEDAFPGSWQVRDAAGSARRVLAQFDQTVVDGLEHAFAQEA
uniref:LRRK2 ARM repeat domain-containing protein n=1 Tax=Alexandrium monilatum TaxID=311494 RepID=A0A7S4S5C3_9DINO